MLTHNGHNGYTASSTAWQTVSVRDFFGHMPWTGESTAMPVMTTGTEAPSLVEVEGLSLQLTVGEFFNRFPWNGKPDIGAPIAPMEIQPDFPTEDSITLDGFADLF